MEVIVPILYQDKVMILRGSGYYSTGRKINSRGTADGECGSITGNGNEEWETMRIDDWFLARKVGIASRAFVSPIGVSDITAGVNREQEEWAEIRIGTPGIHSVINIMRATSDEIAGNLDAKGYLEEKRRIGGEIHDPTFGYLRGSSIGYRKSDDALRKNWAEWDLGNQVYVDPFGWNDSEDAFVRQKHGIMCRYHMGYTRGWESFGDRRAKLSTIAIDKVAIQNDILEGQLGIIDITDGDREEIQHELDLVRNRWGSEGR